MRLSRSWTSKDDRGRRGHFLLSWPRGIFRHALPRASSRSPYSSSSSTSVLLPQDLSDEGPSNRIIVRQSDSRRNSSSVRRYRFVKSSHRQHRDCIGRMRRQLSLVLGIVLLGCFQGRYHFWGCIVRVSHGRNYV